jgi:hypothetical protein
VKKNALRRELSARVQLRATKSVRKLMMKDKITFFSHGFYKLNPGDYFLMVEEGERHIGKEPAE